MEYLALDQVRGRAAECRTELEALLAVKALADKPRARQWRFLRGAVERPFGETLQPEFENLPSGPAAQFKFEAEDRLRRFYLRPGRPLRFVSVHHSELGLCGFSDGAAYPSLAACCLLARDLTEEQIGDRAMDPPALTPYPEKVTRRRCRAEFGAYAALPEVSMGEVERWFSIDGRVYRDYPRPNHTASAARLDHLQPAESIHQAAAASESKKVRGKEAIPGTKEHWYPQWWGTRKQSYVCPYRETSYQLYVLRELPAGTFLG